MTAPLAAGVVDCGVGNLFSVGRALEHAGFAVRTVDAAADLRAVDALVLPGVGAFADAMAALNERGLAGPIKDWVLNDKPFLGICLGMQLLFEESEEFGRHAGLGAVPGRVVRLRAGSAAGPRTKTPNIAWGPVTPTETGAAAWSASLLKDLPAGAWMYFVHSYHAVPRDPAWTVSETPFGDGRFCSSVGRGNVFACQFHPEKSGTNGLKVYNAFAQRARRR